MAFNKKKTERTGAPADMKKFIRTARVLGVIAAILIVLSAAAFCMGYIKTTRDYSSRLATYNDEETHRSGPDTSTFSVNAVSIYKRENFWSQYRVILVPLMLAILGMTVAILALRQEVMVNRFRSQHDNLTGLFNRHTALTKLAGYSGSGKRYAIILTDIDNFKIINETYGHGNGDRLMAEIASRLLAYCDKQGLECCRYGGDEFLVFVKDRRLEGEDDRLVRDIFELFKQPVLLGADLVVPSASMGAANVRSDETAEDAVLDADIALTRAKASGKNLCMFYTEDMRQSVKDITATKNSIASAVQNDGFYMVYQPKVDVATGKVTGYEALVRMKNAAASPAVFIPIAESTGWIRQIGRITTEKAVKQIAEWQKAGAVTHPVSINFSAAQLGDKQFIQFLKELLKTSGVSNSLVEIEITESLFMRDSKQAEELMKEFGDMPVRLLMDDFGTGYSSLSYLTYIPVSTIKIDKSLIDTYLVPGRDSFIRDVINLSHDLGKKVTCEGVETRGQYERLKEFGCDVIQGYYFSKPLPADAVPYFRVEEAKL